VSAGYAYTSIVTGVDEPPRIEVSFYLDDAAEVRVYGLGREQVHLAVRYGQVRVDFSPTRGRITGADVRAARELASQAAIYAADLERLKAEQDARAENEAAA
jgi:hypothetical protein